MSEQKQRPFDIIAAIQSSASRFFQPKTNVSIIVAFSACPCRFSTLFC